jgi:GH24 family phage-related lysozyme (muramidase)
MPKIPTFTSGAEMTTQTGSVTSNIQMSPANNIFTATQSLQKTLSNEYVKEKKLEADNKATLILADLYVNQDNGTKGLYTIQSETGANGNPGDASNSFDNGVNKLWEYAQTNKVGELDNFTKKALEKKFYATAGIFKTKALLDSRNTQFQDTKKITDDFVMKDALALKLNGISYLEAYKKNVLSRIEQDTTLQDSGVKKQQAELYLKFGENTLGASLAVSQPEFLKANISKLTSLSVEEKQKLLNAADGQILENNKQLFTFALNLNEDSTTSQLVDDYQEIVDGTFNGNIDLIKQWQKLPKADKAAIIDFAKTKRRDNTSELNNRQTAFLNENKQKAVNDYTKLFNNSDFLETIDLLKINEVFGDPTNAYELDSKNQIIDLSTKVGQEEFNNVNEYYKNFEIQKKILSGEVKDHITKFTLPGETEAKSITERVGEGISKAEFGFYLNYLLPNTNNPDFMNNNNKLFKLIETLQPSIEGESSLKYIDTTTDNRLNNFQSQMILRFNEGLQKGINVDELLDKTSKNYIGKGLIQIYKSDKDAITQIIAEKSAEVSGNNIEVPPYSEEKYGSVENYLNSQEYLDYKFPGRVKLRKDLLDTSDITQEEFDKGADQMIIDGNVLEISDYDGFPGIEYKGQFYAYDDEGNPPKRFLERLQKDRENNKVKAGKISLAPYKKFEKLIIDEEGLLLKAKKLFKEKNFTIGYGRNRSSIKEGDTITKEKALEYLKEDITIRLDEIQNRIPLFNQFSENLQLALFYEYYRGSVGQSTETIKLINAGKFKEAAEEFLRNDEYINAEELGKKGIRKSMEKVSNLLKQEKAGFI